MADFDLTHPNNAPGDWFVDMDCINCGSCPAIAPKLFEVQGDDLVAIIKQPATEEELLLAEEAMEQCPVESIGRQ